MLPKGWTQSPLREGVRIHSGHAPSDLNLLTEGEIPYVKVEDLNNCEKYQTDSREYLSACRSVVPAQALIFPKRGAAIFANKIRIAARPLALDTNLMGVEVVSGLDPEYLYYAISFAGLHRLADTSTIPQLNNKHVLPHVLPRPSLMEQRRIAQILSTWDQTISATERLLANSEEQKLGLMQELLTGKHRLGGHTAGWQEHHLGRLFAERVEPNRDDLQLLSITREQGVILRDDVGRKDTSNEDKSKYLRICPGDIGYNTMRMWQGVSALSPHEGIISPAYTVITPGELIDGKFASYLFKSQPVVFLFYRHSQGLVSDTWNLKFSHFAKIKIKIPSIQEQRSIAEVLEKADQQIEVIQRQLVALRDEKSALMSQLLTGKCRVKLPDAETEVQA
ncbi:UNVERIFIED_CONTAM: restriction endonuclease subunit S [Comamonas sp. A-3]|nr:restriction endonuclease subunit S [Comamonas thiooxydans]